MRLLSRIPWTHTWTSLSERFFSDKKEESISPKLSHVKMINIKNFIYTERITFYVTPYFFLLAESGLRCKSTSLNVIIICFRIGTSRNKFIQVHANMLKKNFQPNIVHSKYNTFTVCHYHQVKRNIPPSPPKNNKNRIYT